MANRADAPTRPEAALRDAFHIGMPAVLEASDSNHRLSTSCSLVFLPKKGNPGSPKPLP